MATHPSSVSAYGCPWWRGHAEPLQVLENNYQDASATRCSSLDSARGNMPHKLRRDVERPLNQVKSSTTTQMAEMVDVEAKIV